MARYIDADRLLVFLEKNFGNTGGANTLKQLIDIQPTADVAEVKHGKWITKRNELLNETYFKCSECAVEFNCNFSLDFSYCPECGANMDEED